jgi:DNA helicase-2/ATP-dependent DNA helicase PcrA
MHNAKGLEFPVVFIAGMEEGLFPHSRSFDSEKALEEERRLCYVAMTRAEKRLYLSWAKSRRRFGGGELEQTIPSRFLKEVPQELIEKLRDDNDDARQVNLHSERYAVREAVKRNLYTGKTYNSIENIGQFFAERGVKPPSMVPSAPVKKAEAATGIQKPEVRTQTPVPSPRPAPRKKPFGSGSTILHPKYGRGTVLRREGEGDDAKLTVSFPGYGLKKLVEKFAGIKEE